MNILLLSLNEYLPLCVIRCIDDPKIKIYLMIFSNFAPARFSRRCSGLLNVDKSCIKQNDKMAKLINNYCSNNSISLVIPLDIETTLAIAQIKNKLRYKTFPIGSERNLNALHNKWEFYKLLEEISIASPKTFLIKKKKDIDRLRLNYPCIIKPIDKSSGLGVRKIESAMELKRYLKEKNYYNKPPLIIQEFIKGADIDFSAFVKNGKILAWTIQQWTESGDLKFVKNNKILSIAKKIMIYTGYTGLAHIDMRIEEKSNSIKVIEFNPRFWGTVHASLFSGVNFLMIGVYSALGKNISHFNYKQVRYVSPKKILVKLFRGNIKSCIEDLEFSPLRQILADPIPYTIIIFIELRRRLGNRLTNIFLGKE